jgi:hypothetical protein
VWCGTDPELYDQPLTIEVALPGSWPPEEVMVTEPDRLGVVALRTTQAPGRRLIRFDIAPVNGVYIVERKR